jgi:hypothetical protein
VTSFFPFSASPEARAHSSIPVPFPSVSAQERRTQSSEQTDPPDRAGWLINLGFVFFEGQNMLHFIES